VTQLFLRQASPQPRLPQLPGHVGRQAVPTAVHPHALTVTPIQAFARCPSVATLDGLSIGPPKVHPLDPEGELVDQVNRWPVEGEVEVPAAHPGQHLIDRIDAGRRDELGEPGDGGRHVGAAFGDVRRLDIEAGLQL
jgi:hypothetical protein